MVVHGTGIGQRVRGGATPQDSNRQGAHSFQQRREGMKSNESEKGRGE